MVWVLSAALIAGFASNWWAGFLVPCAAVGAGWVERSHRREYLAVLLLGAALFSYGRLSAISLQGDIELVERRAISSAAARVDLSGWVCGFPEYRLGGVRFPLETVIAGRSVRLLVTGVAFGVEYGDSVALEGKFGRTRDGQKFFLMSRGAAGFFRFKRDGVRLLVRGVEGSAARRFAGRAHESVRRHLTRGLGSRCGIPLALLIGERGKISMSLRGVFPKLGISHLLALSGMHLGLVVAVVLFSLRTLRVRNRLSLFIALTIYVYTVGEIVSLHRAYVMAVLLLLASRLERPLRPMDALGTALFLLLLVSPQLAYSVGFQLSFAATFAVLICIKRFPLGRRRGRWRSVWGAAVTSLVISTNVQLFLVPVQIHYFGAVSLLAPPATLAYIPFVAVVLLLSAKAVVVSALAPPAAPVVFEWLGFVAETFERCLFWTSSIAPDRLTPSLPNVFLYYGGVCVFWFVGARVARVVLGTLLCVCSFLVP